MTHAFKLDGSLARLRAAVFGTLLIVAGACEPDSLNPTSETEAGDVLSEGSDPVPFSEPSLSISANRQGTQFGLWQLDWSQLSDQWTSLKKGTSPTTIRQNLESAQNKGARVFIHLAGDPKYYRTSSGKFDLAKFKERLNRFKGVNIGAYISDGTFAGHILFDEPNDPSNWGGSPMPYDQIEAAAKYSKQLWPGLPTLVRARPTWLAKTGLSYNYLDGGWFQYVSRFGSVTSVRDAEINAAKKKGLKVVFGLNVTNGGNGSSGWRGTKSGEWKMSASELLKYGSALIGASTSCGFMMWRYDGDYLSKTSIRDAMRQLRSKAGSTATTTCRS
jgi:hypothetical protein